MTARPANFFNTIAAKTYAAIENQLKQLHVFDSISCAAENGESSACSSAMLTKDQVRWLENAGFIVAFNVPNNNWRITWKHIFQMSLRKAYGDDDDDDSRDFETRSELSDSSSSSSAAAND